MSKQPRLFALDGIPATSVLSSLRVGEVKVPELGVGDHVLLEVEAECVAVTYRRNNDGELVRRQTLVATVDDVAVVDEGSDAEHVATAIGEAAAEAGL